MTYLDTSALATFYFAELDSRAVGEAMARAESTGDLAVSQLAATEMASAASLKLRTGHISEATAHEVLADFERDLGRGLYRRLPLRARHYREARDRIARFDQPLRTLDTVQLANAYLISSGRPTCAIPKDRQLAPRIAAITAVRREFACELTSVRSFRK